MGYDASSGRSAEDVAKICTASRVVSQEFGHQPHLVLWLLCYSAGKVGPSG